jgi:hypothetical protein
MGGEPGWTGFSVVSDGFRNFKPSKRSASVPNPKKIATTGAITQKKNAIG